MSQAERCFSGGGHLGPSGCVAVCYNSGEVVLPALKGEEPGTLLTILRCRGQPPATAVPGPSVNSARLRNSELEGTVHLPQAERWTRTSQG